MKRHSVAILWQIEKVKLVLAVRIAGIHANVDPGAVVILAI